MRTLANIAAAAALVLVAPGCLLEPQEREERLGVIQISPQFPADVGVPDSAAAGEPFVVSIVTYGSACLRAGPTRVRVDGMTADVRPYDLDLGDRTCTAGIEAYPHVATLRFDEPGTATVRFIGLGQPGREIVTIARTVTVE